jgi:hypothetical protein
MVGNEAFARRCEQAFGGLLFRHVYRSDVVPHLPPRSALSYVHAGTERHSSAVDQAWGEPYRRPSGRADLAGALAGVLVGAVESRLVPAGHLGGYSIDDHMPANYLDVSRYTVDPRSIAAAPAKSFARSAKEAVDSLEKAVSGLFRTG